MLFEFRLNYLIDKLRRAGSKIRAIANNYCFCSFNFQINNK